MSVILNGWKALVFRGFWQISARFAKNVSALQATQSSPRLPISPEFSIVFTRERSFMPPLLRSSYFQAFSPQGTAIVRFMRPTTDRPSDVAF